MNMKTWAFLGALLGAAAIGCDQSAVSEVQDEQQDVIEAEQDLRQEKAELRQAEQEAQDAAGETGGPLLPAPTDAPPVQPAEPPAPSEVTSEPGDAPNEGNPDAGAINDAGGAAPQNP